MYAQFNEIDFKFWLDELNQLTLEYLNANSDRSIPVIAYKTGRELSEAQDFGLKTKARTAEEVLADMKMFLQHSVRTGHPHFHNQLYGGLNFWAFLGEVLTALTSTSMATFEVAPVATLIEQTLVDKMSHLIGFRGQDERGEGIMLTGGSNANLAAMLAARNILFPHSKTKGAPQGLVAFCSEEAHYSFSKAANILGLGSENLWTVKSDKDGRMLSRDLEARIAQARTQGLIPYFVGATAGTTVKGAFDPFKEIAVIARREGLWFHVDGAWGGSVALSPTHRSLLAGSEEADSFTWDAHKLMHIPLIASFILFKRQGVLRESHHGGGDTYIFHDYDNKEWDTGPNSLQCGRRVDSLKLWLAWRALGDEGYASLMDTHLEIAKRFSDEVLKRPKFEMVFNRQFLNICFRVKPPQGVSAREHNLKLRQKIARAGRFMVNFSWDGDEPFFRMVIANPQSRYEDYIAFLDELELLSHQS